MNPELNRRISQPEKIRNVPPNCKFDIQLNYRYNLYIEKKKKMIYYYCQKGINKF